LDGFMLYPQAVPVERTYEVLKMCMGTSQCGHLQPDWEFRIGIPNHHDINIHYIVFCQIIAWRTHGVRYSTLASRYLALWLPLLGTYSILSMLGKVTSRASNKVLWGMERGVHTHSRRILTFCFLSRVCDALLTVINKGFGA